MKYTIKELLNDFQVIIPQLQRDYAQGRESEGEIRGKFVKQLNQTLKEGKDILNLDFIYGYTESIQAGSKVFVPLDGQQRLTTLWLLLWYLAPRDEHHQIKKECRTYLRGFTYETRLSSKRFCNCLVTKPIDYHNGRLSEQIEDAPWFMASWILDPTVKSMLNMIDAIADLVERNENAWENLTEKNRITFDYIDIKSEEFKLTDELYIKMNSRGKPLTTFENFKAQFSTLLSSENTDYKDEKKYIGKSQVSYKEYFAFKIDSVWMDLFWGYGKENPAELDGYIYSYIRFVAEFFYYKDNPKETSSKTQVDFDFMNQVFSSKKNIDFLFDSLDWLSGKEDVHGFFKTAFEGISFFEKSTKDYFLRAITTKDFDVRDKVVLYAILHYCIECDVTEPDDEIRVLVRLSRNFLFSVRQANQSRKIEFTSNLRLNNVADYCKLIDELIGYKKKNQDISFHQILCDNKFKGFGKKIINNEKRKAKILLLKPDLKTCIQELENHPQIQGNTVNFKLDDEKIKEKIKAFIEIWSGNTPNHLIVRALLSINEYCIETHSHSALGSIWYFGASGNWNSILTQMNSDTSHSFSETLDEFFETYLVRTEKTVDEKLQSIIDDYQPKKKDWMYYFIKYQSMIKSSKWNLFAWSYKSDFNIHSLGNSGNFPLHSYHHNPYLDTLDEILGDSYDTELYYGRFSELSRIEVNETLDIQIDDNGWTIGLLDENNSELNPALIKKYNLIEDDGYYFFKELDDKDMLETAKDLIGDVIQSHSAPSHA